MEELKKQLAEAEAARVGILKKMEELAHVPVVQKDIDDLRKELTDLIFKRTPPPEPRSTQSGTLVMTDLSVFGSEPWNEKRVDGPITKPTRREKVTLPAWDEMPSSNPK